MLQRLYSEYIEVVQGLYGDFIMRAIAGIMKSRAKKGLMVAAERFLKCISIHLTSSHRQSPSFPRKLNPEIHVFR